jgi:hypothetical protein
MIMQVCRQRKLIALAVCLCFALELVGGCNKVRDSQQAITLAKQEAHQRGWQEARVWSARFEDGRWVIVLERVPVVWGGHAMVEISKGGRVLRFTPGL